MAIVDPVVSMPQVRAVAIKAYGVTAKTRLLSAPDIPTLDETGLPGFHISFLAWALATNRGPTPQKPVRAISQSAPRTSWPPPKSHQQRSPSSSIR
jgi:tripartite-type tricarboxylate transporter receptor subunit TctC